jgi:hypothetical protein
MHHHPVLDAHQRDLAGQVTQIIERAEPRHISDP